MDLALEALELPRLGVAHAQELERDFSAQHRILGEIDIRRSASSEVFQDTVATDFQNIHGAQ